MLLKNMEVLQRKKENELIPASNIHIQNNSTSMYKQSPSLCIEWAVAAS
jgi:hypothetical protein